MTDVSRRLLIPLVAAVSLVAASCGASGDESGGESGGEQAETTTTVADTGASWGDLKNVCGPGEATVAPGEGTSAPGTINVAVGSDRSSEIRPGLNKELWDASVAFAEWCNAAGGIQGLQIELIDADGKLFEVESVMTTICTEAFAMVGGAFTQDDLEFSGKAGSDFHQCNMIDIPGFAVSPTKGLSNGQVQVIPNPPTKKSTQWLTDFKKLEPEDSKKNIVVYGELPSLQVVKTQYDAAVQQVGGIEQLPGLPYPVTGLSDWTPLAQKVKDSGATSLYWIGEPSNAANLFKALRDQGWEGTIINETNIYDDKVFAAGPTAAEGIIVRTAYHPFEEADQWPAVQQYLDTLAQYVPDGKVASLGLQSTSAWLLFVTSASTCAEKNGGVIDRTCVITEAEAVEDWTAGGLHASSDPGRSEPTECGLLVVAKGGKWERLYPEVGGTDDDGDGFHCPPDSVATVTEDLGVEAKINPKYPN
ncbi:MAG: ABC transporter substrate-binding protein [Actinobacteria bacterium]|nr:ABC transporter substrate-binding protein [Actinomycetota bacterium]